MLAEEPDAYFMMGELYMNGNGVKFNQEKAYALWQRAATMGDVRAMVKLAEVLSTKQSNTIGWDMANIPVATSMLECAMKKGFGDAALALSRIVTRKMMPDGTLGEDPSAAAEARGLAVLQEGVKLGSREAANQLAMYFMVQHQLKNINRRTHDDRSTDALRSRYYMYLEYSFDKERPTRLPNLDVALPLPPKNLPEWRDKNDGIVGLWEAATRSPGDATAATPKSVQ